MSKNSPSQLKFVLCESEGIGRIRVDLEPFFDFSFWMAEELQDLVARHQHIARGKLRDVPPLRQTH